MLNGLGNNKFEFYFYLITKEKRHVLIISDPKSRPDPMLCISFIDRVIYKNLFVSLLVIFTQKCNLSFIDTKTKSKTAPRFLPETITPTPNINFAFFLSCD